MDGVITVKFIGSGKVLETTILSKSCKGFTKMQAKKAIYLQSYDKWNSIHRCGLNYKGSSPTMEIAGAEKIFKQ